MTIADFVADVRAATPSAAAELVSRDNSHKIQALSTRQNKLISAIRYFLSEQKHHINAFTHRIERQHPRYRLQQQSQQLDDLESRLTSAIQRLINHQHQRIEKNQHRMELNSPIKRMTSQKAQLVGLEQKLLDAMDRKLLNVGYQLALSLIHI